MLVLFKFKKISNSNSQQQQLWQQQQQQQQPTESFYFYADVECTLKEVQDFVGEMFKIYLEVVAKDGSELVVQHQTSLKTKLSALGSAHGLISLEKHLDGKMASQSFASGV